MIDMSDAMRCTPSSIEAKRDGTIRFTTKNSGKNKHELVLGTEKELKEHCEVMMKSPKIEYDALNMVTVAPGKTPQVSEGAIFQERGAAPATRSRSTATDPIIRPDGGPAAPPCHLAYTARTVVRVPTLPGSPHEHPNDR